MNAAGTVPSILLILVTLTPVRAMAADDAITFAELSKAAKVYLRDSAEFPLSTKVEVTFTDLTGHVRKHKTGVYKYDFHGYNVRSNTANVRLEGSWSTVLSGSTLRRAALATSIAPILLGIVLVPDMEKNATIFQGPFPDLVSVTIKPGGECDPFQWENERYASHSFCGSYELQLGKDDFILKHFAFDASRLPAPADMDVLGHATISRYHSEMEFQNVFLPGDPKPFLVPKRVTVTVETDKGRLVMASNYSLRK
ncbi:MAG TPA: hypothetical protein VFQ41_03550 [Candidatus Angelobacter sp.]|nr:hypothetical protein [Candidatus Angelobacter sp.]